MNELTPPVQKNFYAVGHKYYRGYDKKEIRYLASVTLSDGTIDHIFWYENQTDEGIKFCMTTSFLDGLSDLFILEDA